MKRAIVFVLLALVVGFAVYGQQSRYSYDICAQLSRDQDPSQIPLYDDNDDTLYSVYSFANGNLIYFYVPLKGNFKLVRSGRDIDIVKLTSSEFADISLSTSRPIMIGLIAWDDINTPTNANAPHDFFGEFFTNSAEGWQIFSTRIIPPSTSQTAPAQQYDPESNFRVNQIDGGRAVEIVEYVGNNTTVRIPPSIGGKPVTRIGTYYGGFFDVDGNVLVREFGAFENKQLTSITIGANVNVESNAFDSNFHTVYNNGGKRAGTYVLRNGSWVRQ